MSPTQFQAKREDKCPPPLKINKASHFVKKSSSSSSFSSSSLSSTSVSSTVNGISSSARPLQRQPVIIYTHSPKVIHTNPSNFMALVQKLTGMSRSDNDSTLMPSRPESVIQTDKKRVRMSGGGGDDNESSSGVTEENLYCSRNNGCVDSCMVQQMIDPQIDYMNNIPVFPSNLTNFLCSNQTYCNYSESMLFNSLNTRNSSTFDGSNMKELH